MPYRRSVSAEQTDDSGRQFGHNVQKRQPSSYQKWQDALQERRKAKQVVEKSGPHQCVIWPADWYKWSAAERVASGDTHLLLAMYLGLVMTGKSGI